MPRQGRVLGRRVMRPKRVRGRTDGAWPLSSGRGTLHHMSDGTIAVEKDDGTVFELPDVPNWRVLISSGLTLHGVVPNVWFAKLERRKKDGRWVTTVSGFMAYDSAFEAMLGAAAALQKVKDKPRHVRSGIIRPCATQ